MSTYICGVQFPFFLCLLLGSPQKFWSIDVIKPRVLQTAYASYYDDLTKILGKNVYFSIVLSVDEVQKEK